MTDEKLTTDKTSETHVCYCHVIPYYLKAGLSLSFESPVALFSTPIANMLLFS